MGGAGGAGAGGAVQIVIFIEMIAGGEVETHGGSHSTHAQASEKTTPLVSTSLYFLHFNVCVASFRVHPPVCGQHFIARPEPCGAVNQ